jgi:hypothetical protein
VNNFEVDASDRLCYGEDRSYGHDGLEGHNFGASCEYDFVAASSIFQPTFLFLQK